MTPPQSRSSTSKTVVLAVTTLGSFSTPFIMSSLNVALPTIGREFELSAVALGSLATVYLVVSAAMLIPIGKIADSYGRKKVFLYGMALLSVSSLLSAAAPSFLWLVGSLVLQGAGGAMIFSTALGLLLLAFVGEATSVLFIALTLALLGFGFALFSSPNTNTVLSSVDGRYFGVASATLGTMRLLGQMLSLAIALLVFSVTMGTARVSDAVHGEFVAAVRIAFFISTILCVIGVAASLARGRLRGAPGAARRGLEAPATGDRP